MIIEEASIIEIGKMVVQNLLLVKNTMILRKKRHKMTTPIK